MRTRGSMGDRSRQEILVYLVNLVVIIAITLIRRFVVVVVIVV